MAAKKKTKKEETEKVAVKEPVEEKEVVTPEPKKEAVLKEEKTSDTENVKEESEDSKITSFAQLDTKEEKPQTAKKIVTEEVEDEEKEEEEKPEELEEDIEEETKVEEEAESEEKVDEAEGDEKISSSEVKEWLKDVRPDTTKEVEKGGKPILRVFLIIVVLLAIVGVVGGGIYYNNKKVSTSTPSEEAEETTEATSTPTPEEEEEEVDYTEFSVSILNGSGTPGEAGNVSTLLEELGFVEPSTGNADSYDFTTTTVSLKETLSASVYEQIKETLSEEYIVEKSDTPLEEDSTYDIIIIVGTKK